MILLLFKMSIVLPKKLQSTYQEHPIGCSGFYSNPRYHKGTSVQLDRKRKNQDFLVQQIDKALPNKEKTSGRSGVFWTEKIEENITWILDADLVSFLFGSEEEVKDVPA